MSTRTRGRRSYGSLPERYAWDGAGIEERFWARSGTPGRPDECWEWQGKRNAAGYGCMNVGDAPVQAHRLSFLIAYGWLPVIVAQKCDNRSCVNPRHLFGTTKRKGPASGALLEERFWFKVDKRGPDDCWLWRGGLSAVGYGSFHVSGKTVNAHRWIYEQVKGAVPSGMELDHVCHNIDRSCPRGRCLHRRCVNPHHLEAVTHRTNMRRSLAYAVWDAVNKQWVDC